MTLQFLSFYHTQFPNGCRFYADVSIYTCTCIGAMIGAEEYSSLFVQIFDLIYYNAKLRKINKNSFLAQNKTLAKNFKKIFIVWY